MRLISATTEYQTPFGQLPPWFHNIWKVEKWRVLDLGETIWKQSKPKWKCSQT